MIDLPSPPPDIELNDTAACILTRLSQRSTNELLLLKSLYTKITNSLDCKTPFFLDVPTLQYDLVARTRTAVYRDTGALLAMQEDNARLVLCRVEGCIHKLPREDTSETELRKVKIFNSRLASQHPDHVTNVIRLWQEVINAKEVGMKKNVASDLGLLFQHRHDEVVVLMDSLGIQMESFKKDEKVAVTHHEDKSEENLPPPPTRMKITGRRRRNDADMLYIMQLM